MVCLDQSDDAVVESIGGSSFVCGASEQMRSLVDGLEGAMERSLKDALDNKKLIRVT